MMLASPMLVIDVAHPPRRPEEVETALLEAWSGVRNSGTLRVLKIIHGHGSSGKGGTTRTVVRNWLFRNRSRFKGIIEGEAYTVFDERVVSMREVAGQFSDRDLGAANSGITVVWVR
jgi:hypothetical protein